MPAIAPKRPMLDGQAAQHEAQRQPARDTLELGLAVEVGDQRRGEEQHGAEHHPHSGIDPEKGRDLGVTDVLLLDRGCGEAEFLEQVEDAADRRHHRQQTEGGWRQQARQHDERPHLRQHALRAQKDDAAPTGAAPEIMRQVVGGELGLGRPPAARQRRGAALSRHFRRTSDRFLPVLA
jgi:hypothetical protein